MDNPQRATLAFLCGCLNSRRVNVHSGIYDYEQQRHYPCSFSNNSGNVSVYDYHRRCYLTGIIPSFYDYGVSQYITLTKANDNMYSVYDYHSQSYLSVTCRGDEVTVYDYSKGRYFNYQLN